MTQEKQQPGEDEVGEEQLEDVAGGIDTVPLPEKPLLYTKKKSVRPLDR